MEPRTRQAIAIVVWISFLVRAAVGTMLFFAICSIPVELLGHTTRISTDRARGRLCRPGFFFFWMLTAGCSAVLPGWSARPPSATPSTADEFRERQAISRRRAASDVYASAEKIYPREMSRAAMQACQSSRRSSCSACSTSSPG